MASEPAGAERSRPKPTDLDQIAPDRRRLVLKPVQPTRFALHLLMLSPRDRGIEKTLVPARKALGLRPSEPSAVMYLQDWLGRDLPRGVPWTSYPIVATPSYSVKVSYPVRVYVAEGPQPQPCPVEQLADRVNLVVIHLPRKWPALPESLSDGESEILAMADRLISSLKTDVPVAIVSESANFRESAIVGGREELRLKVEAYEAELRFRYSYAANFTVIAGPALEQALVNPDPKATKFQTAVGAYGETYPDYAGKLRDDIRRRRLPAYLSHPYALQVLYDLQRRGKAPVTVPGLGMRESAWKRELVFGRGAEPVWKGTGKYEPVPINDHLVDRIGEAIAGSLFLRMDRNSIVLSDNGKAFLDAIHPDCMDLDLPMRWRNHPATEEDKESMDAWIARRFRRMKTRVNAIGAAIPETVDDGTDGPSSAM